MMLAQLQDERQAFDEIIEYNFKPVVEKSASVIAVEVGIQLVSLWALATMAVNLWRFCTGC
jgi:hypothetical protein